MWACRLFIAQCICAWWLYEFTSDVLKPSIIWYCVWPATMVANLPVDALHTVERFDLDWLCHKRIECMETDDEGICKLWVSHSRCVISDSLRKRFWGNWWTNIWRCVRLLSKAVGLASRRRELTTLKVSHGSSWVKLFTVAIGHCAELEISCAEMKGAI